MVTVANGGVIQVPTAPKGDAPRPSTFHRARSGRETDNYLWGLKAYFEVTGIKDNAQKVSNDAFSFKDIALVWRCHRCDNVGRGSNPINIWDRFKRELKK